MKTNRDPLRAGYTLIELLVVIVIVALLASLSLTVIGKVKENAYKAQARAMMNGLQAAIQSYRTEYNRFPDVSGSGSTSETPIILGAGNPLLPILHPDQSAGPPSANPKRTDFYDPPLAKDDLYNGVTKGGALNDPWGHPFRVVMDYDGSGSVTDPTGSGSLPLQILVWSTGRPVTSPYENTAPAKFVCNWK